MSKNTVRNKVCVAQAKERNEEEISKLDPSPFLTDKRMDKIEIHMATGHKDSDMSDMKETIAESLPKKGREADFLFVIDAAPSKRAAESTVPSYSKRTKGVLSRVENESSPEDTNCKRTLTCFNCNGNHNMRVCPEPKNYNAIKRNREKALSVKRYHVDDDQRFGHFQAGNISDSLRKALGLGPKQVPKHVYNMRVLGYPPGWLEEHQVTHSGLNLFDSKGKALQTSNNEEGEIESSALKCKYDVSKLISYPGYNEVPETGTLDESIHHRVPPFNPMQSKAFMVERMLGSALECYKKRKMKLCDTTPQLDTDLEDMDLANDESPPKTLYQNCKEDSAIYPAGSIDFELDNNSQKSDNGSSPKDLRSNSPSLNELENTKILLLAELRSCGSTNAKDDIEADCLSLSPSLSLRNFAGASPLSNNSNFGKKSDDINIANSDVLSYEFSINSLPSSPDNSNKYVDIFKLNEADIAYSPTISANEIDVNLLDVTNEFDDMNESDIMNKLNDTVQSNTEISDSASLNESLSSAVNTPQTPNRNESSGSLSERISLINSSPVRKVKTSAFGTPIITYSPYSNLPSSKCFSKQISDVIHFQNLPNSVGKSDKMRGLLAKVRNTLKDMK